MYYRCGHESAVTDSSPETGEVSQSDGGVDKTDFRFPFSPFRLSHATCRTECGSNGREDGDYDVEDLAPSAVVVECTHNVLCFNYSPQKYPYTRTECELARISKGTGERLTLKVKS